MAKHLIIKTKFVGQEGTISESFCMLKRRMYKQIGAELKAYFDDQNSESFCVDILDSDGNETDDVWFQEFGDIFGDDVIEVISVSKVTYDEAIEVFGHEYGQSSLLEIWAQMKNAIDNDPSEDFEIPEDADE